MVFPKMFLILVLFYNLSTNVMLIEMEFGFCYFPLLDNLLASLNNIVQICFLNDLV